MSYGGHALDMIMRLKASQDLKRARREKIKHMKQNGFTVHHHNEVYNDINKVVQPVMSDEQKNEIREKIKNYRNRRWQLTILLLISVILILLITLNLFTR